MKQFLESEDKLHQTDDLLTLGHVDTMVATLWTCFKRIYSSHLQNSSLAARQAGAIKWLAEIPSCVHRYPADGLVSRTHTVLLWTLG